MEAGADLGPLISPEAKDRVCSLIQSGVDEGAKVRSNSNSCFSPVLYFVIYVVGTGWAWLGCPGI